MFKRFEDTKDPVYRKHFKTYLEYMIRMTHMLYGSSSGSGKTVLRDIGQELLELNNNYKLYVQDPLTKEDKEQGVEWMTWEQVENLLHSKQ